MMVLARRGRWMLAFMLILISAAIAVALAVTRPRSLTPVAVHIPLTVRYTQVLKNAGTIFSHPGLVPIYLPTPQVVGYPHRGAHLGQVAFASALLPADQGYHIVIAYPASVWTRKRLLQSAVHAGMDAAIWELSTHVAWSHFVHPYVGASIISRPSRSAKVLSTIHVALSRHIPGTETCWEPASLPHFVSCQVRWRQNHWTLVASSAPPFPPTWSHALALNRANALANARSEVRALDRPLPGQSGDASMTFGESTGASQSVATFRQGQARYLIIAMDGLAAVMADHLRRVAS